MSDLKRTIRFQVESENSKVSVKAKGRLYNVDTVDAFGGTFTDPISIHREAISLSSLMLIDNSRVIYPYRSPDLEPLAHTDMDPHFTEFAPVIQRTIVDFFSVLQPQPGSACDFALTIHFGVPKHTCCVSIKNVLLAPCLEELAVDASIDQAVKPD